MYRRPVVIQFNQNPTLLLQVATRLVAKLLLYVAAGWLPSIRQLDAWFDRVASAHNGVMFEYCIVTSQNTNINDAISTM